MIPTPKTNIDSAIMMLPIPVLADYGLSESRGFLPDVLPLSRLPDPYYSKWEDIAANLQALILSGRIRGVVDNLPIYSVAGLESDAEWRRAYSLLCFIAHAYIWGGDKPSDRLPQPVSTPLQQVSDRLQLPPVATYAALCLWNFKPIFDNESLDDIENLATLNTFSGSLDESWFYLISIAIEARGAPIIPLMLRSLHAVRDQDANVVTHCLGRFAELLANLTSVLQRMHENCDPSIFYNRIRPFLAGSKNMAEAGLPLGVVYEDASGRGKHRQYSGGSNAQSSLIQFFDIILGIEHLPTRDVRERPPLDHLGREPHTVSHAQNPTATGNNFLQEMRDYMPGPHANFLADVAAVANIKHFVYARPQDKALSRAYDSCLAMLSSFRDKHIAIVYRYVIMPAQALPSVSHGTVGSRRRINLATPTHKNEGEFKHGKHRGTGGTSLMPFLRQVRDETGAFAVCDWTNRFLSRQNQDPGDKLASMQPCSGKESVPITLTVLAATWTMDDHIGGICHW